MIEQIRSDKLDGQQPSIDLSLIDFEQNTCFCMTEYHSFADNWHKYSEKQSTPLLFPRCVAVLKSGVFLNCEIAFQMHKMCFYMSDQADISLKDPEYQADVKMKTLTSSQVYNSQCEKSLSLDTQCVYSIAHSILPCRSCSDDVQQDDRFTVQKTDDKHYRMQLKESMCQSQTEPATTSTLISSSTETHTQETCGFF